MTHDSDLTYFAHPSAIISPYATIGDGCTIWQFSHIMDHAILGKQCNIGQNVVISPNVILGNNVKVQNNVSIYTGVTCEDDVFLGPSVVFTNIKNPRSQFPQKDQYILTRVRKGCTIGANATILCGIELSAYAFIGAGAVVTKDVLPHSIVIGNPAKHIGWMSRRGETLDLPKKTKRSETLEATCPKSGERYLLRESQLRLKDV